MPNQITPRQTMVRVEVKARLHRRKLGIRTPVHTHQEGHDGTKECKCEATAWKKDSAHKHIGIQCSGLAASSGYKRVKAASSTALPHVRSHITTRWCTLTKVPGWHPRSGRPAAWRTSHANRHRCAISTLTPLCEHLVSVNCSSYPSSQVLI